MELPNPRGLEGSQTVNCYVLDHKDTAAMFKNNQDFFEHLSLYFGFMAEHYDDQTGYPYPILVRMFMFNHDAQFLMCAKAQALRVTDDTACKDTIYITTKDEHFPGTTLSKVAKKNVFNFDAYKDLPKALKSCKMCDKDLAKMILENLHETGTEELIYTSPIEMNAIRALCMTVLIPFIAEIAPPPDDVIAKIRQLHDITRERLCQANYIDEFLSGLGGSNPGSHMFYLILIKMIAAGLMDFQDVLAGKRQKHVPRCPRRKNMPTNRCANRECSYTATPTMIGPKAKFIPARVGGLLEYRKEMFNPESTAIQTCASQYLGVVSGVAIYSNWHVQRWLL